MREDANRIRLIPTEESMPSRPGKKLRRLRGRQRSALRTVLSVSAAVALLILLWPRNLRGFPEYGPPIRQSADEPAEEWAGLSILREAVLPEWVDVQLIPINGSARRGVELEDLTDIAIHYVGNPGTTAQQNRNYFALPETNVSSHFLIGLEGEVIQCVPLNEKSSATNFRNRDTLSIEVCHPDESGTFTKESYASLVRLTACLCRLTDLNEQNLIRHYDVTGKECPKYFVDHEDAWEAFREDVKAALEEGSD